jgi:DHA3 family macrolide efflux protein-like MFS transporter
METNWKKNTVLFLAGQALSFFGSMVVQYAIVWHITLKTQSGSMMTLFTVAGFLPMFLISPFAGVFVDRFNRKYLINMADGAIALASLLVAVLLVIGFDHVGILLACAIVRSFGQGVQTPAVGAVLPQIVPAEHLTKASGIQGSIHSFVMLSAPMMSGLLMTFNSLKILFFLDVVTATIGISILAFFVKTPSIEKTETAVNKKKFTYFHDLKEGMKYINGYRYILFLVVLSSFLIFSMSPMAFLYPLQVSRNFGSDVWRISAVEIIYSAGLIAGGILISIQSGFKNRVFTLTLACVLFGFESIGLGLVHNFWIYLGIWIAVGLARPFYVTTAMVLLQSTVENEYLGRVLSVYIMGVSVMSPVAMIIFGPLADKVSIDFILIGTGVVMALLAIPFAANKTLREAGQTPRPGIS